MMAAVGSDTSFDRGRQQLHLLAGLKVTTKAVERHAEAIGSDIVAREQVKRDRVVQLEFPEWIWNIADQHFAGAIQIVDIWHAREHLWDLAAKLFPSDETQRKRWAKKLIQKLNRGRVDNVVKELRCFSTRKPQLRDELRIQADYFERNRNRMRYPKFRKQGLFIGSGVIEAGCRTVIGSRLKQSGMFWTVRGANAIIAQRCNRLSGKFEDYWASRSAAA